MNTRATDAAEPVRMMQARFLLPLLLPLLLSACAERPVRPPPVPFAQELAAAQQSYAQGEYQMAADQYGRLAELDRERRQQYLLLAADSALLAGDLTGTEHLLQQIEAAQLTDTDKARMQLIEASLLLDRGRVDETLALLADWDQRRIPTDLLRRGLQLQAQAHRSAGRFTAAAEQLMRLDPLLSGAQRLANQLRILQLLARPQVRAQLVGSPLSDSRGWIALAELLQQVGTDRDALWAGMELWRSSYPTHPAVPELADAYLTELATQRIQLKKVAVALPQQGDLANAAEHIRDGLMAYWYQLPLEDRPELLFLDVSEPDQIWTQYAAALEQGASAIIGPLQKEAVSQLAASTELQLPILALNRIETAAVVPDQLYQFGLAPEEEAEQAADRAWQSGYRFPVMLTSDDALGQRLARAFAERWQRLGGEPPPAATFTPGTNDFSGQIQHLLLLDESKARNAQIERILGRSLQFQPTRRDDIDLVFIAANPTQARQIKPQLAFHFAADLPVFATSRAWTGSISALQAPDIKGIEIPDLPWFAARDQGDPLAAEALAADFPDTRSSLGRLYAMGMDALRLLPELRHLQANPDQSVDGRTGMLSVDANGQVRRQLLWLSLDEQPQVLGYSPLIEPGMAMPAPAPTLAPISQDAVQQAPR